MPTTLDRRLIAPAAAGTAGVLALLWGRESAQAALRLSDRVWPVLLFLVLIKLTADYCDAAGLFTAVSRALARAARGRTGVLFALFCLAATASTAVLSLDTTAVLLTPVALTLARELDLDSWPFAIASVWTANTASLLLPVANLTNLLALDHQGWTAGEFARRTLPAQAAALVVLWTVLALRHRRSLAGRYPVPRQEQARGRRPSAPGLDTSAQDPWLVGTAAVVVLATGPAVLAGAAPWVVAGIDALVMALAFALRERGPGTAWHALRLVPLDMVVLAGGLFVAIDAVSGPLMDALGRFAPAGAGAGAVAALVGGGAVTANLVDNLPAYLALEGLVGSGRDAAARMVALLVGVGVGPLVTPWASLANLLWARVCREQGIEISWWRFAREGVVFVVPALVAAGAVLVLTAG